MSFLTIGSKHQSLKVLLLIHIDLTVIEVACSFILIFIKLLQIHIRFLLLRFAFDNKLYIFYLFARSI